MDHAAADLIEFSDVAKETTTIKSDFSMQDKHETLERSESEMHNKEQHTQRSYFKLIAEALFDFDDVLLFGPTDAKTEFLHFLRQDHKFEKINIEVLPTDKLSDSQKHAFVRDFFKRFDFKM